MIIKGGDANKYSRNHKAAEELFAVFACIGFEIRRGTTRYNHCVGHLSEPDIMQLAEWIMEKNYDVSRDENILFIDWSRK